MSSQPRPGSSPPGPADHDAAEAAGLGRVAWADSSAADSSAADSSAADGSAADSSWTDDAADSSRTDGAPADAGVDAADGSPPAGDAAANGASAGPAPGGADLTVEDLVKDLERVAAERDQYLDASRRLQAEFENYRKAVAKREHEAKERANESLVNQILPVLDACDGALASGASDVEPVRSTLMEALVKQGLDRIDAADIPFDPVQHDAVMHEPAEDSGGPVVAEVLRAGYSWKGRVVRPAMVRVRG